MRTMIIAAGLIALTTAYTPPAHANFVTDIADFIANAISNGVTVGNVVGSGGGGAGTSTGNIGSVCINQDVVTSC